MFLDEALGRDGRAAKAANKKKLPVLPVKQSTVAYSESNMSKLMVNNDKKE